MRLQNREVFTGFFRFQASVGRFYSKIFMYFSSGFTAFLTNRKGFHFYAAQHMRSWVLFRMNGI